MRLLTGENGPGFCKLSKSRIEAADTETGLELVTVAGGVPAGLRRWLLSGWLRAGGVRCLYDLGGNLAGKRAQVLTFSPSFPLSLSPFALFLSGCPRVLLLALSVRSGRAAACPSGRGAGRVVLSCGRWQGGALSCRVCWPSLLLVVLGQSVRALGLALGMGGDPRPTGLLIGKMHKDSIRNAA